MRRRPWPIIILAVLQIFVEPIYNLLLSSYLSKMSTMEYLSHQLASGRLGDLFYILVLPPIMGLCVYAMKTWSYGIFMAGVTWMLVKNLELADASALSRGLFALYYLGNLAFVSYFMVPAVMKPYLRKELRWWESKTRFLVDYPAVVSNSGESKALQIKDFSSGGVFGVSESSLELNKVYQLRISIAPDDHLAVAAKPVFRRPVFQASANDHVNGFGFCFVDLDRETKRKISIHEKSLRAANTMILNRPTGAWQDFKRWSLELARTGRGLFPKL